MLADEQSAAGVGHCLPKGYVPSPPKNALAGPEDCAEAVVIVIATMAKANIIFRILNHLLSLRLRLVCAWMCLLLLRLVGCRLRRLRFWIAGAASALGAYFPTASASDPGCIGIRDDRYQP